MRILKKTFMVHFILYGVSIFLCSFFYFENKGLKQSLSKTEGDKKVLRKSIDSYKKENRKLKLLARYSKIETDVSMIRGLSPIKPINYNIIDKNALKETIIKKMNEFYPEDKFHNMENALKTIGFLEKDVNLRNILINVYREQVAAFYDYKEKELFTVSGSFFTKNIKDLFLAHEIVHAIQDQHFNLSKMGMENLENDDHVQAVTALIEGDATFCMDKYYLNHVNHEILLDILSGLFFAMQQAELDKAPPYIRESMLFPYIEGLYFVSKLYDPESKIKMNQVFLDPPVSTEQIIHFEKYAVNRDEPDYPQIQDNDNIFSDLNLKPIYKNVMGELNIRILLKLLLPKEEAVKAAEGWDGDSVIVFENKGKPEKRGYISISRWDTREDAVEFAKTFLKWALIKYKIKGSDINEFDKNNQISLKVDADFQLSLSLNKNDCVIIYCEHNDYKKLLNLAANQLN